MIRIVACLQVFVLLMESEESGLESLSPNEFQFKKRGEVSQKNFNKIMKIYDEVPPDTWKYNKVIPDYKCSIPFDNYHFVANCMIGERKTLYCSHKKYYSMAPGAGYQPISSCIKKAPYNLIANSNVWKSHPKCYPIFEHNHPTIGWYYYKGCALINGNNRPPQCCSHISSREGQLMDCIDRRLHWTSWSSWSSECSKTCGEGYQTRTRQCLYDGETSTECDGKNSEKKVCNDKPCPVDGKWSNWSDWSKCPKTCGDGEIYRTRECTPPTHGGQPCKGDPKETRDCENSGCPVDGYWSRWSPWTECSNPCGDGEKYQTRTCTNPTPVYGGKKCQGDSKIIIEQCSEKDCPEIPLDPVYAWQSSTFNDGKSFAAGAVNSFCSKGETEILWTSSTLNEYHPGWAINLEKYYYVEKIVVRTRMLNDLTKLNRFHSAYGFVWEKEVSLDNNMDFSKNCSYFEGPPAHDHQNVEFQCQTFGRFAGIVLKQDKQYLEMCHVTIYGIFKPVEWSAWSKCDLICGFGLRYRSRPCPESSESSQKCIGEEKNTEECRVPCYALSLKSSNAKQSSTFKGHKASQAIDGNFSPKYNDNSCSHTKKDARPWWKVTLVVKSFVSIVKIWNHEKDGERLRYFNVLVSDEIPDFHECAKGPSSTPDNGVFAVSCGELADVVKISLPHEEYLTLCEIKIYGNVAFLLSIISVRQSSTHLNGEATHATDGNTKQEFSQGSCSRTLTESDPWWEVELEVKTFVAALKIWNRKAAGQLLGGFKVFVINETKQRFEKCATGPWSTRNGQTITVYCGKVAKRVKIQIPGEEKTLTLCEVKVYGEIVLPLKRESVKQSSTFLPKGKAINAIDGNTNQIYFYGFCSRTKPETIAWWQVELQVKSFVSNVEIWNRKYYGRRLRGFKILVKKEDSSFSTCVTGPSFTQNGEIVAVYCGATAKAVKIRLERFRNILTLCEVIIYGNLAKWNPWESWHVCEPICTTGTRYRTRTCAKTKTADCIGKDKEVEKCKMDCIALPLVESSAKQSSTYDADGKAINAIDGNTNPSYRKGFCSNTEIQSAPWWQVDLKVRSFVSFLRLWNRNTLTERLEGFIVLVSNEYKTRFHKCVDAVKFSNNAARTITVDCNQLATRVRIQIPGKEKVLTICEVKIYGNIGLQIKATSAKQSSDYPNGKASHAIDGNTNQIFDYGFCSQTQEEENPWWKMQLEVKSFVSSIKIWNRNTEGHRLAGCRVHVSSTEAEIKWKICATGPKSTHDAEIITVACEQLARRVKISLPGKRKILSFCEVEIFGFYAVELKAISASQISTYPNGDAKHAIDGNTNQRFEDGSCSQTRTQTDNPWWVAELEKKSIVSFLKIWNQKANSERLDGFQVLVSTTGGDFRLCATSSQSWKLNTPHGEVIKVYCGRMAKKVKVQVPGAKKCVTLCEVKFYGKIYTKE